jgi:hypothetical protein
VAAFAVAALNPDRIPDAVQQGVTLTLESSGILLLALIVGAFLGSTGSRSLLVWTGAAVGIVAVVLTQVLPDDLGFLGSALRFEVPKTVHYWLSGIVAAGAGAALAHAWSSPRLTLPLAARAGLLGAFIVAAALPLRPEPIDAYHLGEHRWSETAAIDLHYAGSGFWRGFPDSRRVVDEPRQEILDRLRDEIAPGLLRHDTQVLHLARSFQQWVATPLGVFDGVFETFVSEDPEVSHQTVGGRLYGFDRLAELLRSGSFGYVVLEPDGLPGGLREQVLAAGYISIFANEQGEVFRITA